jgi:hypothetical protein
MAGRVPIGLPEGLALMPPGPLLGGVLASVGLASLAGEDTVEVLQAEYRQLAFQQARVLRAMVEVGLADAPKSTARMNRPPEFAPDEVRAALVLTRTSATMQMSLAWDLYDRLPEVLARLEAGILDLPRARLLSEWTVDLSEPAAHAVIAAILPRAHMLTTGALAAEVKTLAIAVDPDFARRRYESAVTSRKVIARRNPDGTANLGGYDLPVDGVAVASGFVQQLAAAVKRAGHPGKIDHIRADLYLLLLSPEGRALGDAHLIAELIRRGQEAAATAAAAAPEDRPVPRAQPPGPAEPPKPEPPEPQPAQPAGPGREQPEPEPAQPDNPGRQHEQPEPEPEPAQPGNPAWQQTQPGQPEPEPAQPGAPAREHSEPEPLETEQPESDGPGRDGPGRDEPTGPPTTPSPSGRSVEVRARLSTLLGHDRYPGQIPGWIGPIHAELATQLVLANTGGPWRYIICDPHGTLTHTGPLRTRPTGLARTGAGTVEIQVTTDLLQELSTDPDQAGTWAPVVRELIRHASAPPDDHTTDRDKRLPGARLRRFIHARDQQCVFPGCRIPAHHTDIDHTDQHANGGPTNEANLAPACRHDHRIKHQAGWQLEQPRPGQFRWTSRLGHTYNVPPKPIIQPLPDPIPPSDIPTLDLSTPDGPWNQHLLKPEENEEPQTPRPPPPPTTMDDNDIPPF